MTTNWLTKELTLDLLSITISALVNIHDAIEATTKQPETPKPEIGEGGPGQEPEAATAEDPTPAPAATPAPADNPQEAEPAVTLPQIQTTLRTIAQAEGVDWIQNELFASFHITNITELPAGHYPLAWELITTHQEEMKEAA